MNELLFKAVLAGILFGSWPLFIGKCGLGSSTATLFTTAFTFLFVMPIAITNGITVAGSRWWIAIVAGCMAGLGCLAFNDVMIKSKPTSMALMFVIMLVVQISVPALYHVFVNQQFSIKTIAGFIAAIIACILLYSK